MPVKCRIYRNDKSRPNPNDLLDHIKPEELALYVRRKDVQHVIQLLEAKKVEAGVVSMRGRLEKHCDASEPQVRPNRQPPLFLDDNKIHSTC